MKILDFALKLLGFEVVSDQPKKTKIKREKPQKESPNFAKFNFKSEKKIAETYEQVLAEKAKKQIDSGEVSIFKINKIEELQNVVDFNRKRLPAIIELCGMKKEDEDKVISFMSGAMFAMRGNFEHIDGKFYLCAPENTAQVVKKAD